MLALIITEGRIEARGTDGYAAGADYAPAHTTGVSRVAISREGLNEIETTARANKKDNVTVVLTAQTVTLQFAPKGEPESVTGPALPYPAMQWAHLDRLMERERGEARPEFVAFDPHLFARFAKVRAPLDRVMDLWFSTAEQPVLVKIGGSFRGLVMPLKRAKAEEYTPEGLW
jgi:hypothetical protein